MNCKNCIEGYKKITKSEAKKLHEEGKTIHFLPSMANPFSPWIQLGQFPKEGKFENILNRILIYQPRELGRSVKFYIPL